MQHENNDVTQPEQLMAPRAHAKRAAKQRRARNIEFNAQIMPINTINVSQSP